jgi:hypothetical protein
MSYSSVINFTSAHMPAAGRTSGALEFVPDPEWEAYLSVGWDRSHILDLVTRTAPQMTLQVHKVCLIL